MADKPSENKPGDSKSREELTHSDHNASEKVGALDIQRARNPNADEVAKATKPHPKKILQSGA